MHWLRWVTLPEHHGTYSQKRRKMADLSCQRHRARGHARDTAKLKCLHFLSRCCRCCWRLRCTGALNRMKRGLALNSGASCSCATFHNFYITFATGGVWRSTYALRLSLNGLSKVFLSMFFTCSCKIIPCGTYSGNRLGR